MGAFWRLHPLDPLPREAILAPPLARPKLLVPCQRAPINGLPHSGVSTISRTGLTLLLTTFIVHQHHECLLQSAPSGSNPARLCRLLCKALCILFPSHHCPLATLGKPELQPPICKGCSLSYFYADNNLSACPPNGQCDSTPTRETLGA